MKHDAPRSRRSAITEHRREAARSQRGLSWWMLLYPDVIFTLGPLVYVGIWLLARGNFLWGSLALAAAIALPVYAVLLARGESRLLRRLHDRRERRLAKAGGGPSRGR